MLKSLTDFFQQYLPDAGETTGKEHTLELCAAVLMLEIAMADSGLGDEEHRVIEAAIKQHFHLDDHEIETLVSLARQQLQHATSLHAFIKVVNDTLSREEKTIIVALLWKVAVADKVIDKYEEYFIRKISDLLHVSHRDYIRAKHRALDV